MNVREPVAGILLAGGRSNRMGGGDKCLRPLGSRPILAHIIERLQPQVTNLVINANGEPSRFAPFGLPVVSDSVIGFAGPLAGVHAGLEWVKANCPHIHYGITVATDTPFFPTDLVQRFLAERKERPTLFVARSDAGVHPVIGLWPVAMASKLDESLKRGERKVGTWTKDHGAIEVFFQAIELGGRRIDPFFNINEPRELAEADILVREEAQ
jgi:molybdopterin-guanine dinucleotide biosynthesis protein A